MQILQWLFKLAKEETCSTSSRHDSTPIITNPRTCLKDITRAKTSRQSTQGEKKSLRRGIWQFCRRDVVEEACFYGTLSIRRVSLNCSDRRRRRRWEDLFSFDSKMKQQTEERGGVVSRRRSDSNTIIRVLPVTEAADLNLEGNLEKSSRGGREKEKSEGRAAITRTKELIRWATASKADKAVKFIYPKIKELRKGQLKDESQVMSLRLKCESYTPISATSQYRSGYWITTDSEFVVLEL